MDPPDLVRYLAEFDLTLSDVAPHQAAMFVAGRNSARYVHGLDVPMGTRRRDEEAANLAERPTERTLDLTSYEDEPRESRLPADEMDVCLIRGVEDLAHIFPFQWLLEEVDAELFWVKLAERELLMPQWQRPADQPRDSAESTARREVVREESESFSPKQHAYVLLDTSSTMQDHDRRGTIARGLALEFLRAGHQQRAQLHLRPFTVEAGPRVSGVSREEFRAIARAVIGLPNAGQTRIQTALEQAVRDIRGEGPCLGASILLITDGISRLGKCPLADETLHTFILGDLFEDRSEAGTIATLKQWSDTFHRIWLARFAELLAPTWSDCRAAAAVLQKAVEDGGADRPGSELARLERLLENVKFLVREFRRSLDKNSPLPAELPELEKRLKNLEVMFRVIGAKAAPGRLDTTAKPGDPRGHPLSGAVPETHALDEGCPPSWRFWPGVPFGRRGANAWRWAGLVWKRLWRIVLGACQWIYRQWRGLRRRRSYRRPRHWQAPQDTRDSGHGTPSGRE